MKRRAPRIFLTFLLSYVTILSVPLAIGCLGYYRASQIISHNVSTSQLGLLKQIRDILDAEISGIQYMSWQISQNSLVDDFLKVGRNLTPAERLESSYVSRELKPYATGRSLLWSFFVYFAKSDSIITPSARYDPALYFDYILVEDRTDPLRLYDYVRDFRGFFACLPAMRISGEDGSRTVIPVVQAIRSAELNNPPGVVVAFIDEPKLADLIGNTYPGSFVEITDGAGRTILTSGARPGDLPSLASIRFRPGADTIRFVDHYAVSSTVSRDSSFHLYSFVPQRTYLRELRNFTNLMIVILCLAALVGTGVAILFARRNSQPLRQLLDSMGKIEGVGAEAAGRGGRSELLYIRDAAIEAFRKNRQLEERYEKIITENTRFRAHLGRNTDLMKSALLTKLLKDRGGETESRVDWLALYGIELAGRIAQVVVIRVDTYGDAAHAEGERERNLIRFFLTTLTEEFSRHGFASYPCELEYDLFASILTSENGAPAAAVRLVCERIQTFLQEHYRADLSMGIGNPVSEAGKLSASYERARDALEYGIVREQGAVVSYEEIVDTEKDYYYPIDAELDLIKAVRAGDYGRCESILDTVFEENLRNRRLSAKLLRCLIFDMIGTVMKTLDQVRVGLDEVLDTEQDTVEELLSKTSATETMTRIKSLYQALCTRLEERRSDHALALRSRILAYIGEHYTEVGLSQTLIADALGISVPYLSAFFKHETGGSMVDHINRLRVEHAKRLLSRPEQTLAEIARACGFGSDKSLIRLFKHYEGVTPGRYRESRVLVSFAPKREIG